LDGGPHVFVGLHQIPARGEELVAFDAAAFVDAGGIAGEAVGYDATPGDVAIAFDDGVGFAFFEGLLGKEGGVNSAVYDPGAARSRYSSNFVSAQGVAGMDADADDVSGMDAFGNNRLKGFVDEDRISCRFRSSCCEYKQPSRCNYSGTKGIVTGIY